MGEFKGITVKLTGGTVQMELEAYLQLHSTIFKLEKKLLSTEDKLKKIQHLAGGRI